MAGEVQRLWGTIGADITDYLTKLDQVESRAKSTAGVLGSTLGKISVGIPAGWEQTAGGLAVPAGALAQVSQEAATATRQVNALGGVFRSLGPLMGISFGVMGVKQIAGATVEMAKLGAQSERLERGFTTLAGTQADRMLERMRDASRGAISDMALMQAANKAMLLQVTSSGEELGRLLEVSAVRGHAMGLSTEQAFSDLVTGIGRMAPMILDNLGILTGGEKGFEAYAKSIGKTADALTDAEKRHYLLEKVLNDTATATLQAGSAAEDSATKFERLGAAWANVRAETGKSFAEGFAGPAGGVATFLENWAKGQRQARDTRTEMQAFAEDLAYVQKHGLLTGEALQELQNRWGLLNYDVNAGAVAGKAVGAELEKIRNLSPAVAAALDEKARAAAFLGDTLAVVRREMADIRALGWTPALTLPNVSMAAGGLGAMSAFGLEYQLRDVRAEEEARREARERDRDARERQARESQQQWDQQRRQQQQLRSTVEGLLTPTGVTDIDMARTRLGTYTDQWDEYIRRVRSAATDANSVWKSLIPTDVLERGADAVRIWAAETEKAFYAGQLPEQINWEAFDQALRAELARQEAREKLIATGMQRAGGAASRADVATALGLPEAPGVALGDNLVKGLTSVDLGKPLTDAFRESLQAEAEHWKTLGAVAMGWFTTGAEGAVTPSLLRRWADMLFPELYNKFNNTLPRP